MKARFARLLAASLAAVLLAGPIAPVTVLPVITANAAERAASGTAAAPASSSKYQHSQMKQLIAKYAGENADVKGWLVVPGTNISKPVVFKNTDQRNAYYESRDIKGVDYTGQTYLNFKSTAEYMDYRTVFGNTWKESSKNTVIYGHNWTNLREPNLDIGKENEHIMFGQLPSYTNLEFTKANPYIYFSTGDKEGIWKIFSVCYCEVSSKFNYNNPNMNADQFAYIVSELKKRSIYDFDVDLKTGDNILTLTTCTRTYGVGDNQRFIVVARLLRDGETENDPVNITMNEDYKRPQF